jgi:hypothetical protein
MNRSRRVLAAAAIGMSMAERCVGATMNAPLGGTRSLPWTVSPSQVRHSATTSPRITR